MEKAELLKLYSDTRRCAEQIGLCYSSDRDPGITRMKRGKGWAFKGTDGKTINDQTLKERLHKLAVPPAWQDVWICPNENGHVIATGVDDKGRKQYMYHRSWRMMRDILNFYKLLSFGEFLPAIRRAARRQLTQGPILDQQQILALMLWFLDNGYIRIGNDIYFEENESIGLVTLSREHIRLKSSCIELSFVGKSHQEQTIELRHPAAARLMRELLKRPGDRIFVAKDGTPYTAEDCNAYLHGITNNSVSAKNFRTWGGTLAAFGHLKRNRKSNEKPEKVVVEAVDKAAEALGNTRAVARSHYVHPHILETYANDNFNELYQKIKPGNKRELTKDENELLAFLELLFQREFDLLKTRKT